MELTLTQKDGVLDLTRRLEPIEFLGRICQSSYGYSLLREDSDELPKLTEDCEEDLEKGTYIVLFSNGVVKVGMSASSTTKRIRAAKVSSYTVGAEVVKSVQFSNKFGISERMLITAANKVANTTLSKEFFQFNSVAAGLSFISTHVEKYEHSKSNYRFSPSITRDKGQSGVMLNSMFGLHKFHNSSNTEFEKVVSGLATIGLPENKGRGLLAYCFSDSKHDDLDINFADILFIAFNYNKAGDILEVLADTISKYSLLDGTTPKIEDITSFIGTIGFAGNYGSGDIITNELPDSAYKLSIFNSVFHEDTLVFFSRKSQQMVSRDFQFSYTDKMLSDFSNTQKVFCT